MKYQVTGRCKVSGHPELFVTGDPDNPFSGGWLVNQSPWLTGSPLTREEAGRVALRVATQAWLGAGVAVDSVKVVAIDPLAN